MDCVEVVPGDPGDEEGEEGGEEVSTAVRSPVHGRLGNVPDGEGLEVGHQTLVVPPAALDLSGAHQEALAPPLQQLEPPEVPVLLLSLDDSAGFQLQKLLGLEGFILPHTETCYWELFEIWI